MIVTLSNSKTQIKIPAGVLVSGLSVLSGVIAAFFVIVLILVYVNKRIMSSSQQLFDHESDCSRSTSRSSHSIKLNQISISPVEQSVSPRQYQNGGRPKYNGRSSRVSVQSRISHQSTQQSRASYQNRTSAVMGITNRAYVEDF